MDTVLRWIGPACILLGSLLTAANAGARTTGYGLVLFTCGSAFLAVSAYLGHDFFGTFVNLALMVINVVGARRWLGHNAVIEEAASHAHEKSKSSEHIPTIAPLSQLLGRKVLDSKHDAYGEVADVMVETEGMKLSYIVVHPAHSDVGTGFVGVRPDCVNVGVEEVLLTCATRECVALADSEWPAKLP
jgi:sporulation protein YlmC with PRC-barrel domain